jgi:hypothetical protein
MNTRKVYITDFSLHKGIIEAVTTNPSPADGFLEVIYSDPSGTRRKRFFSHLKWSLTMEEAIARAEILRQEELESIQADINYYLSLTNEIPALRKKHEELSNATFEQTVMKGLPPDKE